ncbi:uncharacterized protein N7473_008043 [Penicillium subrubescens]|jgi:hypothetical protein|uniref:Uncharacterized protein n=1 Tax=Penicillium subrubescens TaxID=1316194 RepID=A0A1Q5TFF6_9EURO|nr:uncharacterized protein N7473_008043 [Penicillium subrubescens]KAJ5891815.1 hypothetical protein N7473_008043 [Penicillium subrubescens]OKO98966.1 hypothetical protein PENSUB_8883 [Penicillium subrubescens]
MAVSLDLGKLIHDSKPDGHLITNLKVARMTPEYVTRKDLENLKADIETYLGKIRFLTVHIIDILAQKIKDLQAEIRSREP